MATYLRNEGVPLGVVQLLLGHADPRTTKLYARLSIGTARQEYDRAMSALAATRPGDHPQIPAILSGFTGEPSSGR